MPAVPSRPAGRLTAAVLAAATAVTLAGCVDEAVTPRLPTATTSPAPTATAAPAVSPSAAPEPLTISCGELVDPDTVYAFDPNFALLDHWDPAPGSPAAQALDAGGVVCRWVRESGGSTIELSVARLDDEAITAQKNAAFASSQMVPTYGEEAYFQVEGDVGTAIVFQGPYWLVIASEAFAEPGEATPFVESALAALPAG